MEDSPSPSNPSRGLIVRRCCEGLCPRCGGPGLFPGEPENPATMKRSGFRLRWECPYCGLRFEEESGVTLWTTVVGYVVVVLAVVVPILLAVVFRIIGTWTGVTIGLVGSIALPILLYPFFLRLVLAAWFGFSPDSLDQNDDNVPPQFY